MTTKDLPPADLLTLLQVLAKRFPPDPPRNHGVTLSKDGKRLDLQVATRGTFFGFFLDHDDLLHPERSVDLMELSITKQVEGTSFPMRPRFEVQTGVLSLCTWHTVPLTLAHLYVADDGTHSADFLPLDRPFPDAIASWADEIREAVRAIEASVRQDLASWPESPMACLDVVYAEGNAALDLFGLRPPVSPFSFRWERKPSFLCVDAAGVDATAQAMRENRDTWATLWFEQQGKPYDRRGLPPAPAAAVAKDP